MNELSESGTKVKNHAVRLNLTVDWNILSYLKFSSLLGISTNNNYQTYWAGEKSYYVSMKRQTPYGTPLPKDPSNDFLDRCEIPMGGELVNEDTL